LERDGLQGALSPHRGRDEHDSAHGAAVPHARLRVLLWPGRRFRRRDVLRRLLGALRRLYVRPERVQIDFPSEGVRDGNHLGDARGHHCGGHPGHNYGPHHSLHLRIVVRVK